MVFSSMAADPMDREFEEELQRKKIPTEVQTYLHSGGICSFKRLANDVDDRSEVQALLMDPVALDLSLIHI